MLASVESEHLRLTDHEISFEEFQPMSSQSVNVTDGQTDRRTDGRTDDMRSQDRALHCSKNTLLPVPTCSYYLSLNAIYRA